MTPELTNLDPRIRRTRQMLFQAFQDLLCVKAFDTITVQDIAERSTVNRATFYDHFTDKYALLEAMMSERFATLFASRMTEGDGTCEKSLNQLILAVCDFLAEASSGCQKNQRQFEPLVEARVKAAVREFLIIGLEKKGAENADLRATMASWAISGAALQWSREKSVPAEQLAETIRQMVRAMI